MSKSTSPPRLGPMLQPLIAVTAVETQYYWPNLVDDVKEVLRTLKPGGMLIVLAETYAGGLAEKLVRPTMKLIKAKTLSAAEQESLFASAGYSDIQIIEERSRGWICAVGRKPLYVPKAAGRECRLRVGSGGPRMVSRCPSLLRVG